MRYLATLLVVRDLEQAKRFYMELMGCRVTDDFGANVTMDDAFSLQTLDTWADFLHCGSETVGFGGKDAELYFEAADFDAFVEKLAAWPGIQYVHAVQEHAWGQRAVRFFDPDGHIVEVGENMAAVCRRFRAQGLTDEQTAKRMDVAVDFVRRCLQEDFA